MVVVSQSSWDSFSKSMEGSILSRINKEKAYFFFGKRSAYTNSASENKFYSPGVSIYIPGKSFALGYMDLDISSRRWIQTFCYDLGDVTTEGWVIQLESDRVPKNILETIESIDDFAREGKVYLAEREAFESVLAEYKERRENWRETCRKIKEAEKALLSNWKSLDKDIKKANKEALASWQSLYDSAESQEEKDALVKPEFKIAPPKPMESVLPEKPEEPVQSRNGGAPSLISYALDFQDGWYLVKRFKVLQVEGTSLFFLKRRKEMLNYSAKDILEAHEADDYFGKISIEQFNAIIDEFQGKKGKNADNIVQKAKVTEQVDFLSECSLTHVEDKDLLFKEDLLIEEPLPPLTAIKPMHAASMLAGGIGAIFKMVVLDGDQYAIKSALVKERIEKTINLNGVSTLTVIEQLSPSLGAYNMDKLELKMLYAGGTAG